MLQMVLSAPSWRSVQNLPWDGDLAVQLACLAPFPRSNRGRVGVRGLSAPSAPLWFNLPFSVPLRFNLSLPLIGDYRLLTRDYRLKIARRWHSRSHPPKSCQFSAALPHTRRHKMSIQRSRGSVPPAISAGKCAKCANFANLGVL